MLPFALFLYWSELFAKSGLFCRNKLWNRKKIQKFGVFSISVFTASCSPLPNWNTTCDNLKVEECYCAWDKNNRAYARSVIDPIMLVRRNAWKTICYARKRSLERSALMAFGCRGLLLSIIYMVEMPFWCKFTWLAIVTCSRRWLAHMDGDLGADDSRMSPVLAAYFGGS